MPHSTIFKAPISTLLSTYLLAAALTACKAPQADRANLDQTTKINQALAPMRTALTCLPHRAAMIAAHRGTDERWRDKAENSLGALSDLIAHGTRIAEIDVAGLKDGTLITFHDGVWDDISTGKGPISRSQKSDLEKILLKSRSGGLTTDRPPTFANMLSAAKNRIYLEVDFKSSANPRAVISAIRAADMADQVLLIAYTQKQAATFARLAPEMLRSNPPEATKKGHAVWMGYGVANSGGKKAAAYRGQGLFTIGRLGDPNRQPPFAELKTAADILVTDQAQKYKGVEGLSKKDKAEYTACLKNRANP